MLEREFEIPDSWDGSDLCLFLERVNIASELFIDERQIGRQIIELSAPHIYRMRVCAQDNAAPVTNPCLGIAFITPGRHTLTLRIDNRDLIGLDGMASGYSIDTQGIWFGIIGRIELRREASTHLENVQIYPQENGIEVKCTIANRSDSKVSVDESRKLGYVTLKLSVKDPVGRILPPKSETTRLFTSRQSV